MSAVQSPIESRLPAHGREQLALRKRGKVPDGDLVIAVDCWTWGLGYPRVVIPKDLDADAADLRFCAGISCFLAWGASKTSVQRRDAIIRQIVRCKPSRLWVCDMQAPEHSFFVVTGRDGVVLPEYQ